MSEEKEDNYETRLLKILIHLPSAVPEVRAGLPAEAFLSLQNREVFKELIEYYDNSRSVAPTKDILNYLLAQRHKQNKDVYEALVSRLYDDKKFYVEDHYNHLPFILKKIGSDWEAAALKRQLEKAVNIIKEKGDHQEALRVLQDGLPQLRGTHEQGDMMLDLMASSDDLDHRRAHPELFGGIPLGFPSMDEHTHGLGRGEMAVVIGGTGVGKSLTLGQIAVNVARQGKRVLLVTVENKKRDYMNRLYSNLSRIPYWKFKTAQLEPEDKASWLKAMADLPEDFWFKIVEFPEGCSSNDIWFYMKSLGEEVEFLVVDQITNMLPNAAKERGGKSLPPMSWLWFGQIALDLKRLCAAAYKNKGVPLLTAAQASGGTVGKKVLTTDDVAMGKIILHHAHAGIYITKDEEEAYTMGASKWRDALVKEFPVFPEFKYWSLAEEHNYSDTAQRPVQPSPRPTPPPPTKTPTPVPEQAPAAPEGYGEVPQDDGPPDEGLPMHPDDLGIETDDDGMGGTS